MNKIIALLTILTLSLTSYAYVPSNSLSQGVSIGAEWIYFSPTSESVAIGAVTTFGNNTESIRNSINQFDEFHSGYRLFASFDFCNCKSFFAATWTDFKMTHSLDLSISDNQEFGSYLLLENIFILEIFESASDHKDFHYSALDAIVGRDLLCNCCFDAKLFAGLHYARLNSVDRPQIVGERRDFFNPPPGSFIINGRVQSTFWGIGPEIGASIEGNIGCGFSFQGIATGAIIMGSSKNSISQSGPESPVDFIWNTGWRTVPYGDIRLQANYAFCCPGFCWDLFKGVISVGYETLVYCNGLLSQGAESAGNNIFEFNIYRNVTMHGPFVSLALAF